MIHFIYKVPVASSIFRGNIERIQRVWMQLSGKHIYTSWRTGGRFSQDHRRIAPYAITYHLFNFLSKRTSVLLYDLEEPGGLAYMDDDIILGHPWMESNTIVHQALLNRANCRLKALIFPIHHGIPEINHYARPLVERADMVFGIMGPYWYETIDKSEFSSWKRKLIPLDMAIDINLFPYLKNRFNPPGKRGYLYIGRNSKEKGTNILSTTMAGLLEYPRGWIGSGEEIPNMIRESDFARFAPKYVNYLATKYDFFVNTSISDANPTTILEAMAWGFPVTCTPQSGYYNMPTIINLDKADIQYNIEILRELQYWPTDKLKELSIYNRHLVETSYTWDRFCSTVWENLRMYL